MKRKSQLWINKALIIGTTVICLTHLPAMSNAMETNGSIVTGQLEDALVELENRAADIWGPDNVWVPQPKVWVQYEYDFGERSFVDFEKGVANVQILLRVDDKPGRGMVLAHLRQGLGNLILAEARDSVEMIKAQKSWKQLSGQKGGKAPKLPDRKDIQVYIVRQGDSLWKIARRVRMKTKELAKLNGLVKDAVLPVGLPLKVMVYSSHDLTLESAPQPKAKDPLLLDQIRMADGRPVSQSLVREFVTELVGNQPSEIEKVTGADGITRLAVGVKFKLVSNHMEIRARKFHPLVLSYAKKYKLDPAIIMAIIHTESVFNPRARSRTPAYGLMQIVPHSGGTEAYRTIYGKKRKLTFHYLYDPENNIELGVAYFNILKNRYMGKILDSTSRTYCAVAAYNTGASNVGRAFVSKKSINLAAPVINSLGPQEVYARLVGSLPFKESRNYISKVLKRALMYEKWQ